ncbi:unnamed protein product [Rotaria sp. Silwood2]|nr:unnamed protein product [Rotaria sp. Silwood2]CAF3545018.1 unnamed protein product [Rotaria sp. Silwood2]CAF4005634.1 unnamed protein product [Rotaria sp. Silwood2]
MTMMKIIYFLLLFIVPIKCIEWKKENHTYVVVPNKTIRPNQLYGFRIFDSKQKTLLYQLKVSSKDMDTAMLVDNPTKNMVGNLEGIWIDKAFNITFSVYDNKLIKWTDGIIQSKWHLLSPYYTMEYNNEQFIAKWKGVSRQANVYTKNQNELLAEWRPPTLSLLWKYPKYNLKIYSNKLPDAIYFFLLLVMDHRYLDYDS